MTSSPDLVSSETSRGAAILILDHDDGERELLGYWLVEQGFAVLDAADSAEALELFHAHPQALVLLDRQTEASSPVLAQLRGVNPGLRCCLLGCDEPPHDVAHCFPKPLSLFDLTAVLCQLAAEVVHVERG
ncbi:MAG: hypothetical protein AB7K24_34585 [Gemmataceae bacterium]